MWTLYLRDLADPPCEFVAVFELVDVPLKQAWYLNASILLAAMPSSRATYLRQFLLIDAILFQKSSSFFHQQVVQRV
jgi:hypothetical protein